MMKSGNSNAGTSDGKRGNTSQSAIASASSFVFRGDSSAEFMENRSKFITAFQSAICYDYVSEDSNPDPDPLDVETPGVRSVQPVDNEHFVWPEFKHVFPLVNQVAPNPPEHLFDADVSGFDYDPDAKPRPNKLNLYRPPTKLKIGAAEVLVYENIIPRFLELLEDFRYEKFVLKRKHLKTLKTTLDAIKDQANIQIVTRQTRIDAAITAAYTAFSRELKEVEDEYKKQVPIYEKAKKFHQELIGKAISVFNEHMSGRSIRQIQSLLNERKVRASWMTLIHHYGDRATHNSSDVYALETKLDNVVYQMETPLTHLFTSLEEVFQRLDDVKASPVEDERKVYYLVKAIDRCRDKEFKRRAETHTFESGILYEDLKARLLKVENLYRNSTEYRERNQRQASANNASGKAQKKVETKPNASGTGLKGVSKSEPNIWCPHCNKMVYHTPDKCFSQQYCGHCGVKGHIKDYCYQLKREKRVRKKDEDTSSNKKQKTEGK